VKKVANPFNIRHVIYAFAGLVIGGIIGYMVGLFLMGLGVSSASNINNQTIAMRFVNMFLPVPMNYSIAGAVLLFALGFLYSYEKEEKEEKEKQQVVVVQAPQK
jgi:cytochrome bd-type quinol oxidase subunit 2